MSRSTGLDAQTLRELKQVLETKKKKIEGGAGEEELGKVDGKMHRLLKSDERPVHDRNSVLLTPTADYTIALRMIETAQKRAKEASGKTRGDGEGSGGAGRTSQFDPRPGAVGSGASSAAAADSSRLHPPIIIVPSDPSAMVNMTNIVDFLEKAHFVSISLVLFWRTQYFSGCTPIFHASRFGPFLSLSLPTSISLSLGRSARTRQVQGYPQASQGADHQ